MAATPAGPCAAYPGDDTWTDAPFAEGVVLIGDAAGHNDPIIGQGLSIALRDARIVRDLILDGARTAAAFASYGEERSSRMERLRFIADVLAVAQAEDADNRVRPAHDVRRADGGRRSSARSGHAGRVRRTRDRSGRVARPRNPRTLALCLSHVAPKWAPPRGSARARLASQAASASPIGVDGGPSTNGHSSSAMRRQFAVACSRPSTACSPRLMRCVITNAGGTFDDLGDVRVRTVRDRSTSPHGLRRVLRAQR